MVDVYCREYDRANSIAPDSSGVGKKFARMGKKAVSKTVPKVAVKTDDEEPGIIGVCNLSGQHPRKKDPAFFSRQC